MYGAEIVYSEGAKGSNGAVEVALEMAQGPAPTTCPTSTATRPTRVPTTRHGSRDPRRARRGGRLRRRARTGGTLMGNGRRLKEANPETLIVAAEPMQGEPVQGLRSLDDGFIPPIIDLSLLDRKIIVTNRDAIVWTQAAARRGGDLRRGLLRRDRARSRCASPASSTRATSFSLIRRRRLEVPLLGRLHQTHRGDRESGLHRLVVAEE